MLSKGIEYVQFLSPSLSLLFLFKREKTENVSIYNVWLFLEENKSTAKKKNRK